MSGVALRDFGSPRQGIARPRLVRQEPWLFAIVVAIAVIDAVVPVLQHVHFETGLDLSLADQAVWNYSHFHAPFSSILGKDILGDHFSPLVAILTPLYWIWSDPRMLLIAQSALVAASVVPVFLFASERLGRGAAYAVAIAYACYWPTQVGVAFDFHEVAFAPLLIALTILYTERRQWVAMWISVALLLCVKEDMSLLVMFLGIYLLTRREWRNGIALVVVGIVWYELAVSVVIPAESGGVGYAHWAYGELGKNLSQALWALVKAPWKVITIAVTPFKKVETMAALFTPFLFLAFGSRLMILAIPLLAERFLSNNPLFWQTHFQYSMPIAPVIAMAAIDSLAKLRAVLPERFRGIGVKACAVAFVAINLVLSLHVMSGSALTRLVDGYAFETPSYVAGASETIAHVPAGAPLVTNNFALPHASQRPNVQLLSLRTAELVHYMAVDVTDPGCCGTVGNGTVASLASEIATGLQTMTPIYYDHGWLAAVRDYQPTNGVLIPLPAAAARALKRLAHAGDVAGGRGAACAGSITCVAGPLSSYRVVQVRTAAELVSVGPALRGGCADLARAAAEADRELAAALLPLIAAARDRDRPGFASAYAAEQAEANNLALAQRNQLLLAVCIPR
jgi:uncharacterized membrane protein